MTRKVAIILQYFTVKDKLTVNISLRVFKRGDSIIKYFAANKAITEHGIPKILMGILFQNILRIKEIVYIDSKEYENSRI